jgi:hypothetical protein
MRRFVPLLGLLLATTACGGGGNQERRSSEDLRTMDVSEERSFSVNSSAPHAPPPPPGVSVSAAPGVAFNYRYAFRLPGERIAAVQEQHAAACEKLGLDRCRIIGMRYRLVDQDDVEAMLAFKLDPAIARSFGKAGIDLVTRSEGMLVDSEISGEDAGAEIQAASRSEAEYAEELERVEQQLARAGLKSAERAELQAQADRLRQSIRAVRANRADRQESLAKTPVVFNYGSGDLVPGFDDRSPIRTALERAGDNFVGGLATLLVVGLTLLPYALVALLLFWLYRRFGRRVGAQFSTRSAASTLDAETSSG